MGLSEQTVTASATQKTRGQKREAETAHSLCGQAGLTNRRLWELILNAEFQCTETRVGMLKRGVQTLRPPYRALSLSTGS